MDRMRHSVLLAKSGNDHRQAAAVARRRRLCLFFSLLRLSNCSLVFPPSRSLFFSPFFYIPPLTVQDRRAPGRPRLRQGRRGRGHVRRRHPAPLGRAGQVDAGRRRRGAQGRRQGAQRGRPRALLQVRRDRDQDGQGRVCAAQGKEKMWGRRGSRKRNYELVRSAPKVQFRFESVSVGVVGLFLTSTTTTATTRASPSRAPLSLASLFGTHLFPKRQTSTNESTYLL